MRARHFYSIFFFAGALTMLIMSLHYFQYYLTGVLKNKTVSQELWYHMLLRVHIIAGMIGMFIGPVQFLKGFRARYLNWHKRLGYAYVMSIVVSSITGLLVAQFAMGGFISSLGFSILAIVWFSTTIVAIRFAISKDIHLHQKWMIRSFALTFSSIPQRLMLLLAFTSYIDFVDIYRLSAWLSWMFNLTIAEVIIWRLKITNVK